MEAFCINCTRPSSGTFLPFFFFYECREGLGPRLGLSKLPKNLRSSNHCYFTDDVYTGMYVYSVRDCLTVQSPAHTNAQSGLQPTPMLSLVSSPHQCSVWSPAHTNAQSGLQPTPMLSLVSGPHQCSVWSPAHTNAQSGLRPTPMLSLVSSPYQCSVWSPAHTNAQSSLRPTPMLSLVSGPHQCSVWSPAHTNAQSGLVVLGPHLITAIPELLK